MRRVVVRPARPVAGLMVGAAVGSRMAQNRQEKKMTQQELHQQELEIQRQQMEIEQLKKDQEKSNSSSSNNISSSSGYQTIQVVIPQGVQAGMTFKVSVGNAQYDVPCPQGAYPGMTISVQVPNPQPVITVHSAPAPVAAAIPSYSSYPPQPVAATAPPAYNPNYAASEGRSLLNKALSSTDQLFVLKKDHIVDEYSSAMQTHQIISVPKGAIVTLIGGDLINGLGGAYKDYILVNYNGKKGKISRLVVEEYVDAPPPPIGLDSGPPPALF